MVKSDDDFEELDRTAANCVSNVSGQIGVSSLVLAAARCVRKGLPLQRNEIEILKRALAFDETRWRERVLACWALGESDLDPVTRGDVTRLVNELVADRIQSFREVKRLLRAVARTVIAFTVGYGLYFILAAPPAITGLGLMIAIIATPLYSLVYDASRNDCARQMGAWYLGRHGSVNALPSLGTFASLGRSDFSLHPLSSLWRMLLRFERQDAPIPPKPAGEISDFLCRQLQHARPECVGEIVSALRCVGNDRAIGKLRRESARHREEPELTSLIDQTITVIAERLRIANAPNELLRAASESVTAAETLLRAPTSLSDDNAAEQLLRSSGEQERLP